MSEAGSPQKGVAACVPWHSGVRTRLLLAFLGIAAFTVLAAAAGLYALTEVGTRFEAVERRLPATLTALELSSSAERIAAVAPALLASAERSRRDAIRRRLATEGERMRAAVSAPDGGRAAPRDSLERVVSSLLESLVDLDDAVARRVVASERVRASRNAIFRTEAGIRRLLAPWHDVLDEQIERLVGRPSGPASSGLDGESDALSSWIGLQRSTQRAQRQATAAANLLLEASSAEDRRRLSVLDFQLDLTIDELRRTASGLDDRLRPLLLARTSVLRSFGSGPRSVFDDRRRELALIEEGERRLARTTRLSNRLVTAVDRLGDIARDDVIEAAEAAVRVRDRSARALLALAASSVLASALIVWLYVGRNVGRRLSELGGRMDAVSRGDLHRPVTMTGSDEIAVMGRAVEVFRRNTLERDQLLGRQERAAERLEREVESRTAELEIANTFKSRFLAAASHDLRQPLHALNLFVAQLHEETEPSEQARLAARIDLALASMNELFEELLDMAKLDAGVLEPTLTTFPASRLLERLQATFEDTARARGLRFRAVPCDVRITGDFVLLERILLNLVSNALRYTVEGGVVIGCRRDGPRLRFDVVDSGPGIPIERRERVFDEFYQLSPAGAGRSAGLGLGLAIVERLARLLECPVELDSRTDAGSRFSISVTRAPATGAGTMAPPSPPLAIADRLPGKLVVVLDDDELVLDGMAGILQRWGCRVVTASDAASARDRLVAAGTPPDLIISDYQLRGGRTGIEAISTLRRTLGETLPAFLISGDTSPERLHEASASGHRLLCKPVTPMTLRTVITRLLAEKIDTVHACISASDTIDDRGRTSGSVSRRR